jgi:hypothetical protein
MANQYEYEDETEEQDNGPAELRKALKKAQKEREAIEAELSQLRSDMRSRSVKDVLASKGVSDKLAKLIPSDVNTPEQIDAWLKLNTVMYLVLNKKNLFNLPLMKKQSTLINESIMLLQQHRTLQVSKRNTKRLWLRKQKMNLISCCLVKLSVGNRNYYQP